MKRLVVLQWICLGLHSLAMVFGLAGLLLVLPHPAFILTLPNVGQTLFQLSMSGGGAVYIVFGAAAIALYGYRVLGLSALLRFAIPAVGLSLASELIGTSTGFPFGHYAYLSGLGYKVAGLVPFTIPLSWFYMGFAAYLLAYSGLSQIEPSRSGSDWWRKGLAVGLGAIFLTAWDLVLDPAMSQALHPFWTFQEVGAFFGMPYRNLVGWMGTGMVFMGVGSLLGGAQPLMLTRAQLTVPLWIYVANFIFGSAITLTQLDSRFWIPVGLGFAAGVLPAWICWRIAQPEAAHSATDTSETVGSPPESVATPVLSGPTEG